MRLVSNDDHGCRFREYLYSMESAAGDDTVLQGRMDGGEHGGQKG
jgi:hypothetical protein